MAAVVVVFLCSVFGFRKNSGLARAGWLSARKLGGLEGEARRTFPFLVVDGHQGLRCEGRYKECVGVCEAQEESETVHTQSLSLSLCLSLLRGWEWEKPRTTMS